MNCRFCNHSLSIEFIDLVNSPASNSFLTKEQLNEPEIFYPLKVFVCDDCFLWAVGCVDVERRKSARHSAECVKTQCSDRLDLVSSTRNQRTSKTFVKEILAADGKAEDFIRLNG